HHSGIPARESSQFCIRAITTIITGRSLPDTPIFILMGERPRVMGDLYYRLSMVEILLVLHEIMLGRAV
ncbi:MAG TPA: hypothetical protein VIY49_01245, partial [Bryobacteraceae bacterium]